MTVTADDIKGMLPTYQGLTDDQITEAIELAKSFCYGINENWESLPDYENILKLAAVAQTLELHFPQNVNAYDSLNRKVMEMLTSIWSSSNMVKRKTRFVKVVEPE